MPATQPENVLGAGLFFAYILAALAITFLIVYDLFKLYASDRSTLINTTKPVTSVHHINLLAALSVLSFSVLSYHMLSFLIVSYTAWADANNIALPHSLFGDGSVLGVTGVRAQILSWKWATSSTLFQDFAEVICNDPLRFWWTQHNLLFSIALNTYMAIEGTHLEIPRLWAYFALDQILPASFTQNLFCLTMLLKERTHSETKLYAAQSSLQVWCILAYLASVAVAPLTVETNWFLPMLFITRMLLLAPLIVLKPSRQESWRTPTQSYYNLLGNYLPSAFVLVAGSLVLEIRQTALARPGLDAARALGDSPAIATLGYDFLISVASFAISNVAVWPCTLAYRIGLASPQRSILRRHV